LIADDRVSGPVPGSPPTPIARWTGLLVVLLVEIVVIGFLFQSGTGSGQVQGWIGGVFETHPSVGTLCFAALVALLLIYARRIWGKSPQQSEQFCQYAPFWPVFLSHLLLFCAFAAFTARVLKEDMRLTTWPGAWALAWSVLGVASLGLWGAAVFPLGLWQWVFRRWWVVFPAALAVGVAAVAAGKLTDQLWQPLGRGTLCLVDRAFTLAGVQTVYDPTELRVGTRSFVIKIDPGCSGYEGMGLIWVFLAGYIWLFQQEFRFPHALLLFPLGVLVIWFANVLRLIILVALGTWVSPALAMGGFHSQAGWLAFLAVSLGLVTVAQRTRFFSAATVPEEAVVPEDATGPEETAGPTNPAAVYLAPMLVLVGASMITSAFSAAFDYGYPLRVLAVAGALWIFRRQYRDLGLHRTWSWTAVAIGAATFALWLALEPASSGAAAKALPQELANMPALWAALWLIFRVIGSVVTVPLAEELAFRGYLPRQLIAADFQEAPLNRFTWFSFLVSSVVFGALHGRWLAGTLAGMLFALALYRRGKLGDAVVAHATTNALLAAYVLATGRWALWV
jgi:exosortase E/protease (VPEID-CTERM system)